MPEFVTTQQDATYVAPQVPEDPVRQDAIDEAHIDATVTIVNESVSAASETYEMTGDAKTAAVVGGLVATYTAFTECYVSCHAQSPPREPVPAPEIDTGEEDEKKEKEKENDN